ncbi:lipopolysaccharide heptosyltransferase II [Campylobacter sp. FMV-PI01]|uniref:lipopolysaccharide heptosyltransferase II n=1 Tax=Campylobacter portucalensis TaxID=2608384 RepID=A0A6L5WHL9_9BACT|nr:lipopolysaccharide heptosyltransferase II [Campylobacter portucalensis]MSN96544.1 lipopolysaccharide heptosyltransferase II [Campylobacter portucalensis]
MKILIEIPNWLGDAVMSSPAVQNIIKAYPNAQITILGSFISNFVFKNYPNVEKFIINDSKNHKFRFLYLIKFARNLGKFDLAFSFRRSFSSKFMMKFVSSKKKFCYKRYTKDEIHLVIRYNDFINRSLNLSTLPGDLKLCYKKHDFKKKTLGINPGATYGSAKRWYPGEFAKVALSLSKEFDIVIFGGKNEIEIANDIENILVQNRVLNYQNLAGLTSVDELIEKIAGLSLFITNDSGPMHIAAAFKVPTIAIFGPTKFSETSQWNNPHSKIITKNLECSPCMKRVCPLEHHNCMKNIKAQDVLEEFKNLKKDMDER